MTPEGHKIILAKLIDTNPDNYTFTGQVKAFDMATMLMQHQEGPHDGLIVVTDMKDVTFGHFTKLGVAKIKKFFYYLQVVYSIIFFLMGVSIFFCLGSHACKDKRITFRVHSSFHGQNNIFN